MEDKELKDQLAGLFSGLEEAAEEGWGAPAGEQGSRGEREQGSADGISLAPLPPYSSAPLGDGRGRKGMVSALPQARGLPTPFAVPARPVPARGVQWRWIVWAVLGTLGAVMLAAYGQALFMLPGQPAAAGTPRYVVPPTLTPRASHHRRNAVSTLGDSG